MVKKVFVGMCLGVALIASERPAAAHDLNNTAVTWSQTVSRIFFERCATCHREGGTAFSLMTYNEVRPWAVAIREEILARTMPPWGAVKGFGDFRNDSGLSPAQTNLILSWAEGGVPEGEPENMPEIPVFAEDAPSFEELASIRGGMTLENTFRFGGLFPRNFPEDGSFQIFAELPDGRVKPLIWLYEYRNEFEHPFLFNAPLELPAGTVIRGIPEGASLALLPAEASQPAGD